jgi:4-aminobutyrate aminotransferase-like enzyme
MPKYQVPGPKSAEYLAMSAEYEKGCTSSQPPVIWESAQGCVVRDVDGNEYLDWTSGVLVTNVGHCHPKHVQAIQDQVGRLMCPYDYRTPVRSELAKRLVESMPPSAKNLDSCFLLTTGSEATEAAMRVAKRHTGRHEVISFWGGFHGRTWGAMSMAGKQGTKQRWGPLMPGTLYSPYAYCYRCPFQMRPETCGLFCADWLDHIVETESTGDVAALILEPYQGGAGFIFPPEGWLTKVQNWCRARNVLFIVDEVQASFGRTGRMYCLEHESLTPNMLCLGKGIGSGIPCAATMFESRLLAGIGEMSSTSGGNPVSCAAALAVLDIMEEENLLANCQRVGAYMLARLQQLVERSPVCGDARGKGLVIGLEFVKDKRTKEPAGDLCQAICEGLVANGVLCGRVGWWGQVMRIAPPLVITMEQAEQSLDALETTLGEVAG